MENTDVLIIGAGAAGLMAAHTLARKGKRAIILEASNRTGGRIHTIEDALFFNHAELGAEFVHGNLPVTLTLLNEAGIAFTPAGGEMWQYSSGTFTKDAAMIEEWGLLMEKLNALQHDMTLDDFLEQYFADVKFDDLKNSVRRYAAGYDTSDPAQASAQALYREWKNEDEDAQHRINGGYCTLIQYLANSCKQSGSTIYLNAPVKHINWQQGKVTAYTVDGDTYQATKAIFAIPLGVWQANPGTRGHIVFEPAIDRQSNAFKQMGFGAVIKILLHFDEPFWEDEVTEELAGNSLNNMGFLFSEEVVPTWWTQAPQHAPLLTGWLGGPAATRWAGMQTEDILHESLLSLANIFNRSYEWLKNRLIASHVANWTTHPYVYGSYAYDTVNTPQALALLRQPVNDTLYFAGEFMYQGPAMGTVEAALTSGRDVAAMILSKVAPR